MDCAAAETLPPRSPERSEGAEPVQRKTAGPRRSRPCVNRQIPEFLPAHAPDELRRARRALGRRDLVGARAGARGDLVREVQRLRGVEDFRTELEPRATRQLELL